MFVLTVDQRRSRLDDDRVAQVLRLLNHRDRAKGRVRAFERTAGDEVQGVLDDPALVVDLTLALVRDGHWSVGVGVGTVRRPLPRSARAGAGSSYEHARRAVERAKLSQDRVAVEGTADAARDAEALLGLLSAVVQRRSAAGWQAADLVGSGLSQTEAAAKLRITKQALSQRLHAGLWTHESRVRPVAALMLAVADDRDPLSGPEGRMGA